MLNGRPARDSEATSLWEVFERTAADLPDRLALQVGERQLSYEDLNRLSERLAARAVKATGTVPQRIGVFAGRSTEAFVGALATLRLGAVYVPLNTRFPIERTVAMARAASLDILIVDEVARKMIATAGIAFAGTAHIVAADGLESDDPALLQNVEPVSGSGTDQRNGALDRIAYLLFTSGSTGVPKGVPITHRNVLHYLGAMQKVLELGPDDRCSQTFDTTFDLSVHDMFVAWQAGASLHVLSSVDLLAPVRFVQRRQLTVWFSVPSLAALAVKRRTLSPRAMPSLRLSLFCGEPLPNHVACEWQSATAPDGRLLNLYGPTELTIACFTYELSEVDASRGDSDVIVPIGTPLEGLGYLIESEDGKPATSGELLVCGPQTSPGYWNDLGRTEEKFVFRQSDSGEQGRYYRTGDRVRRGDLGCLHYLGRLDNQVKVRGFRVELEEVETALLRHRGVLQAAVIGWPEKEGIVEALVAFVVAHAVDVDSLIRACEETLPEYMVPRDIRFIAEMPLNANGKIDRRGLKALSARADAS